jgi:hypothetical protein
MKGIEIAASKQMQVARMGFFLMAVAFLLCRVIKASQSKKRKMQIPCHLSGRQGEAGQKFFLYVFMCLEGGKMAPHPAWGWVPKRATKRESNLITLGQFLDHFFLVPQSLEVHDPKGPPADKAGVFLGAIPFGSVERKVSVFRLTFP